MHDKKSLLTLNRELRRQSEHMVEANLKLLEQHEIIREQRTKLADANLKLLERTEELEAARERAWKLLLNILPENVAIELVDLSEMGSDQAN